jgi:hypothetical protein
MPLHSAAIKGRTSVVKALLEYRADVNAVSTYVGRSLSRYFLTLMRLVGTLVFQSQFTLLRSVAMLK